MINVAIIRYPGSNCDLETFNYFNFNNQNKCFYIYGIKKPTFLY